MAYGLKACSCNPLRCILCWLLGAQRCEVHAASQWQKGITGILIICHLYSFVMCEQQVLNMFVLQVVQWACIVAPVNTQCIPNTHPHSPLHTPPPLLHTPPHIHTLIPTPTQPPTHLLLYFSNILCMELND